MNLENKIKNVIIINDYNYSQGGASKVAIDNANLLCEMGMNCILFSPVYKNTCEVNKNVQIVSTNEKDSLNCNNKIKGAIKGLNNKNLAKKLDVLLDKYSPLDTVVHVHGWTKACSAKVFKVAEKKGFNVYLTMHEYFSICPNGALYNYNKMKACNYRPLSFKCIKCNCDSRSYMFKLYRTLRTYVYKYDMNMKKIRVIYISKFEKRIFEKLGFKFNREMVLPNYVETIKNNDNKKIYDFVFVGRTSPEKGIELYLKLVSKLKDKKFLLIGDYKENKYENLYVTGWISENEVDKYINESRCMVFPSLWPETFGLNAIKSVQSGMLCIASYNTALEDYIINGKNGFLFKQGDFDDLYNKAEKIFALENTIDKCENNEQDYVNKLLLYYNS